MTEVSFQVCVVGLGYIGLPTAAMFATHGLRVVGVDTDPAVVVAINGGDTHILEPGMGALLREAIGSGNLTAQSEVQTSDVYVVAVPTPLTPDHRPDLGNVLAACRSISRHLCPGNLVVIQSTVPPGTTLRTIAPLLEEYGLRAGEDFTLAYCPERVLPGTILREIVENDRTIGGIDATSTGRAVDLYASFVSGSIYGTDATTAEMVKLSENTFRDVNISLANELARIASQVGVDVWQVIDMANRHPRVNLHRPGPGVGGHCIPVDPWFLVDAVPEAARLIRTGREVNDAQPGLVVKVVLDLLGHTPHPKAALLGVAYKADVDDTRGSPALDVIYGLEVAGVAVSVHDPHMRQFMRPQADLEQAFRDADIAVLLTDHREFQSLDPYRLGTLMRSRNMLDTRHCLDADRWRKAGFHVDVLGVGRVLR
ncbi:MAG: nucleotide sugar dehydrogenase [Dehalococcoidia bacterium]|nr:nucleotide sugar dehydrogenase [Dehalococcoidia bacterium]